MITCNVVQSLYLSSLVIKRGSGLLVGFIYVSLVLRKVNVISLTVFSGSLYITKEAFSWKLKINKSIMTFVQLLLKKTLL